MSKPFKNPEEKLTQVHVAVRQKLADKIGKPKLREMLKKAAEDIYLKTEL